MHPIKIMRENRTMTQQTLAMAACVSLSTVKRAEAGKSISKESMLSIASVLEIEPRHLSAGPMDVETRKNQVYRNNLLMPVVFLPLVAFHYWYVNWVGAFWLDVLSSPASLPFREIMSGLPAPVSVLLTVGQLVVGTVPPMLLYGIAGVCLYRSFRSPTDKLPWLEWVRARVTWSRG